MINTRYLAGAVFAAGCTLTACAAEPATVAAPAAAPAISPSASQAVIRLAYIEFLVPSEKLADLVAQKPDFNALLAEAKAGKVGVVISGLACRDGHQAVSKAAAQVRYPTSHGFIGMMDTAPAPAPAHAKLPQFQPQDFAVQEVGFTLACTPTIKMDGKTVDLELAANLTAMDTAPGEHRDTGNFPCPPRFSVNEVNSRISVKNHVATHVATFQPAPGAKEPRTRVVFISADFGE